MDKIKLINKINKYEFRGCFTSQMCASGPSPLSRPRPGDVETQTPHYQGNVNVGGGEPEEGNDELYQRYWVISRQNNNI